MSIKSKHVGQSTVYYNAVSTSHWLSFSGQINGKDKLERICNKWLWHLTDSAAEKPWNTSVPSHIWTMYFLHTITQHPAEAVDCNNGDFW